MRSGHVYLELDRDRQGIVHVGESAELPPLNSSGAGRLIVWAGVFNDRDAALMHAHNKLCRKLVDINNKLYQVSVGQAIAALETDILPHRRVFIDQSLDKATLNEIDRWSNYYRNRRHRLETVLSWIKVIAIGLLLINLILGF